MIVKQGNRYVVQGPITLATVGGLISDEKIALDGDDIIVDLAGVTAVDSSALSFLLELVRRRRSGSGRIAFANLGDSLHSLAELYGVVDVLPIAAH